MTENETIPPARNDVLSVGESGRILYVIERFGLQTACFSAESYEIDLTEVNSILTVPDSVFEDGRSRTVRTMAKGTGQASSDIPDVAGSSRLGIVGAGGGGFPTAVKLRTRVPTLIVNGAECEPLLHKDKELLLHQAAPLLRGLHVAMALVGAREGVVGIKEKYTGRDRGARAAAARRRPAPAAARHLPGRRRVRAGLRRDRPRHPARRPAEGRGRGGLQRRDAGQHRPRPARDAQVPDGGGRRSRAGDAACPDRDVDRRGNRRRRRADRAELGGAPRRRHDGAPRRRSRRTDHQDAWRDRRAARVTPAGRRGTGPAGGRSSVSADRRATSAGSARSCARATCSATRSSRTRRCRRSGSPARARCWWPARSIAASATCAASTPARRTSTRRTSASSAKPVAREAGLAWKGDAGIGHAAPAGRTRGASRCAG